MLTSVVGKVTAIVILERFGTAWANTPAFFDLARHLRVSMHALIIFYVGRAELGISHDLIARLMELAEQADESSLLLLAHEHLGILRYFEGNSSDALKQFEQAIALCEPAEHRYLAHLHGEDLGVFSRIWMAWALWIVGYPNQALATSHEALELGEEASHPFSLGYAFLWTASETVSAGEPTPAVPAARPARLTVVVFPWGDVWIDGKRRGAAPLKNVSLNPGRYKISAGQGKPSKTQTIRLREAQRKTVQFDLTK